MNQSLIDQLPRIGPIGWYLQPNWPIRRIDRHRVTEPLGLNEDEDDNDEDVNSYQSDGDDIVLMEIESQVAEFNAC